MSETQSDAAGLVLYFSAAAWSSPMADGPAELWCKNCGAIGSRAQYLFRNPGALSCCPERDVVTLNKIWFKLPMKLRRRWWNATRYGKLPPPYELIVEAKKIIEPRS